MPRILNFGFAAAAICILFGAEARVQDVLPNLDDVATIFQSEHFSP